MNPSHNEIPTLAVVPFQRFIFLLQKYTPLCHAVPGKVWRALAGLLALAILHEGSIDGGLDAAPVVGWAWCPGKHPGESVPAIVIAGVLRRTKQCV